MYDTEWIRERKMDELQTKRVAKTRRNRTNHYGLDSLYDYDHYGMDVDDDVRGSSSASMQFGR